MEREVEIIYRLLRESSLDGSILVLWADHSWGLLILTVSLVQLLLVFCIFFPV